MQFIVAAELASTLFVIVSLISHLSERNKLRSGRSLTVCLIMMIIWLLSDVCAYSINGPSYPMFFLWISNFMAYITGGLVFLSFIHYCYAYIGEKTKIKPVIFLVPAILTMVNEVVNVVLFLLGKLIVFNDGYAVVVGEVPAISQLINIVMLLYLPIVAFAKRKAIGIKAVSLLGFYGIAPIIAIVIVLITGIDLSVVLGSVALVVVVSLLQKDEAQKRIMEMNEELERANTSLLQVTAEQESQLSEISALNSQLQDNQAHLEESAAEQEAQYEEITNLNKKLEEKQQYNDVLYHKLLRVQSCGIVAYKIPSHDVIIMNDMARRMYDLPVDEDIDNETIIRHISKARYDDEGTKERLRSIRNPGDSHSFSFWIDNEERGEIHVYVTTQLIRMDNDDLLVVSSLLDITEITKMERDTARANAANTAKTAFLFNMSHDIRTPMNAIIGYSELMEKNLDNKERTRDYLKKIKSSSDFLLSLINNVLEMSRIESGKAVLDEEIISTGITVNEVKSVYEELMREKNISFIETENIKTPYVFGDKVKLNEIFLNLVSNAYKYTPEGGSVSIDMSELPCDRKGWIILRTIVKDSGIGMSEEFLPSIFEEFTRERSVTDTKIQGTGLGMPIVKKLVDLMGGSITVESELGKGSEFTVLIPHRIAPAPSEISEKAREVNMSCLIGKHILLAEDNDLNAEIATEILKEAGIIVDRAEDGIVCVDKLTKAKPGTYDVILMDIQMPNMDGYKATEKIRRLPDKEKANIPIIAMTANAFDEDKKNALNAGMNGHLAKPINVPELMKTLSGVIKVQDEFAASQDSLREEVPAHVKKIILDMQCSNTVASLPGGLFVYEAKQPEHLIYANPMACSIWGCKSFDELNALARGSFRGLVHPDDYDRIEKEIWDQIKGGSEGLDQVKYRIKKKNGTVSSIDDYGRLVRDDANGDIFYVFVAESFEQK